VAEMINAYPVAGKRKAADICQAFLDGAGGGKLVTDGVLRDGAAVFYGVDASNVNVWRDVLRQRRTYYYADNAYFDQSRGTHFRVTKDGLQHSGAGHSTGARFVRLNITIKPWRVGGGSHVVLCPQSPHFMKTLAGVDFDWVVTTKAALANFTSLPLRVREWSPDKGALSATLGDDLRGAHALVTWSSAAAVTAVLNGVPVVCTGPCAAKPMAGDLADVEHLPTPERSTWAAVLADHQWSLDEMRAGLAWKTLHAA
jgi:hypothetical protein